MKEVVQLSVHDLLSCDEYLIPLYQRNYSWKREEIHQLLSDISNAETSSPYYLGTLVVWHKKEVFEIIDGQQRHTTLLLINAVLHNRSYIHSVSKSNLFFEGRENNKKIFDSLLESGESYEATKKSNNLNGEQNNIIEALMSIEDFLNVHLPIDGLESFADKFYKQVFVFRAPLPEETDVNHYFEIMNNRGEQLEKHEILKASMLNSISSVGYKKVFSVIWDACSQMNSHIQLNLDDSFKEGLFVKNEIPTLETLDSFLSSDEGQTLRKDDASKENNSLISIIDSYVLPLDFTQEVKEKSFDKFSSIIDFPNFLLQVLKLENPATRLDDAFLLVEFDYPHIKINAIDFILTLLRYRILFDRFVIKRELTNEDWNWSLKGYSCQEKNLRSSFENSEQRQRVKMMQSMLHVTFYASNYKNWLHDFLISVKGKCLNEISAESILNTLEQYSKRYYAVLTNKNSQPNQDVFALGVSTPWFLFNYVDYILWVVYYEKQNDNRYGFMNKVDKGKFSNFKFVQRASREHLFPQSRIEDLKPMGDYSKEDILNCFGNLCLISSISNSAYNNDLPVQKRYDSKTKNESLKQTVMFSSFQGDVWSSNEILSHGIEMKKILEDYIVSIC